MNVFCAAGPLKRTTVVCKGSPSLPPIANNDDLFDPPTFAYSTDETTFLPANEFN
eukprot:CAMPEP_0197740674 /NCGR_PEP_ID=MMETSP1435-20131217/24875_1 /TAXON_ID=426625 /ORGANISM="Chaetoceros brevis, Strain CCMP164" /LENGTH=54 /DNA_ID=CAMNT_0043330441 /DNA_START=192 /DNA_END=353 /DNA_ORIENTATION=+